MNMYEEKIAPIVFASVEELKDLLLNGETSFSLNTKLFGDEGGLDSLGLVNLVVLVEQKVRDEMGVKISLADERALSQKDSPFISIHSLVQYVSTLVSESQV